MNNYESILNINTYIGVCSVVLILILYVFAKKSIKFRKPFIIATIVYNLIYLVWRTVFTLPLSFGLASVILSLILLLAEWMGFWQSMIFRILFWKPYQTGIEPILEFELAPTVDVFIATYNENMKILRKTIIACLNLHYPKDKLNIYLCDDGKRAEASFLCEELGIHYISRKDNQHAKAGNINHALEETNGEFIMLLDADMVPKSCFLDKTIGYFRDEKVGFVQTPQIFYNPDPFQFNLGFNQSIPNEQDFFMLDIQAGRANYNAVLHVGTNAVFRRTAIEKIGGIPTGTITEDMATGMLIQAKGFQSIFVKEVLCTGLSVESFGDLIKQRERWCRGNIQVSKKWNPISLKGLSLAQRIIYMDGLVYWFFGVQKMIYILCPIIYLLFGTIILHATTYDLLLYWFPSFLASLLSFRALTNKSRSITWSHIYEVAMSPFLSLAALVEAIFSKPIPFKVTPKGTNSVKTTFAWTIAIPHIVLLVLTVLGWVITVPHISAGSSSFVNSAVINIAWSIYNIFAIILSVLVCVERPRKRTSERLAADEIIKLSLDEGAACKIVDISEAGVKIECDNVKEDNEQEQNVHFTIDEIGKMEGTVAWRKGSSGKKSFGIAFKHHSHEVYKNLLKFISDKNKGYHSNK